MGFWLALYLFTCVNSRTWSWHPCDWALLSVSKYRVVSFPLNLPVTASKQTKKTIGTFCFKARSLLFNITLLVHWVKPHSVRLRSSFLTNFALSLYSPWHMLRRYKPASADNAPDRNAPSIPNKQDAQPWGEQEPGPGQWDSQTCFISLSLYIWWELLQNGTAVFHAGSLKGGLYQRFKMSFPV